MIRIKRERIVPIVLTGGPCAGKTEATTHLKAKTIALGWQVHTIEEPATALFTQWPGLKKRFLRALARVDRSTLFEIESAITRFSLQSLHRGVGLAELLGGRWILLLDRAIPDNRVYLPPGSLGDSIYASILRNLGYPHPRDVFLDYSGVIKLTTAALGAERFYTCANNDSRNESIEEARELDRRISTAYAGHRCFYEIDNSTDFEGKLARAVGAMKKILRQR